MGRPEGVPDHKVLVIERAVVRDVGGEARSARMEVRVLPGGDEPDYWDFVYFSFVVGMTAQVSDVGISDKMIRRTATAHGVVSFVFNTALVALMVNIAASAI